MELIQVAPQQLVPHVNNVHSELRNIDELAEIIAEAGIIEPLVVIPAEENGQYTIMAGHRRHAAAMRIGLESVPCVVVADVSAGDQIATMYVENHHRDGLTLDEESRAFEQLALLDWEPERIAKATGRGVDHVRNSLTLRTLPQSVQHAASAGDIDLAVAAELAEFADDEKVMNRLLGRVEGSNPHLLRHAVIDERRKRDNKREAEKLKAQLVLDDVTVTPKPRDLGASAGPTRLEDLVDAEGNALDTEALKTTDGFAAYIDTSWIEPKVVYYCADPAAAGYEPRPGTAAADSIAREERKAAQEARNRAWKDARAVRMQFLTETYGTAKTAKSRFKQALRDLLANGRPHLYSDMRALASTLAGIDVYELPAECGVDRLNRVTVAFWLAGLEDRFGYCAPGSYIHSSPGRMLDYIQMLLADGYALSEIEEEAVARIENARAEQQAAEDAALEDDDEDAEEEDPELESEPDEDHNTEEEDDAATEPADEAELVNA